MTDRPPIEVTCPGCQSILTVDAETGSVLLHRPAEPAAPKKNIDQAVKALKDQAGRREELFRKSLEAEKNKSDRLKKSFDEALKRAEQEPDVPPPLREIDLD